ncbi:WXG100 family type VII secretion target [Propionibacteriaceae bacterium G1746]|uniref:WXG100 family type VII secretion target n=1 Tax=Aestuariimicrobium sp. G57 TaxID=3418485 RepID=UPI003C13E525
MGDFTLVNSSAMQQGIGDLRNAHTQLNSTLDTLKGQLNQNLSEWDGAAREAYTVVQQQWDASAAKMADIINKMTSVMTSISEGYDSNEKSVQSRWS